MTTTSFFSIQAAPTGNATMPAAESTAAAKEPTAQGFKTVYDKQQQHMSGTSESMESEEGSKVLPLQAMTETTQDAAVINYGLPLLGQNLSASDDSVPVLLTPEILSGLVNEEGQPLNHWTMVQDAANNGQGQPMPMMTLMAESEATDSAEFSEFDHLMQQRSMSPVVRQPEKTADTSLATATGTAATTVASNAAMQAGVVESTQQTSLQKQAMATGATLTDAQTNAQENAATDALGGEQLLESVTPTEWEGEVPDTTDNQLGKSQALTQTLLDEEPQLTEQAMDALEGEADLIPQHKANLNEAKTEITQAKAVKTETLSAQPQDSQFKIDVSPKDNRWSERIAERISIMNTEQLQQARIQLDPPELGTLEIRIRVQQDQVSVAFNSGHQVVREALDSQSARLRELLEQQGINLADVSVSDQGQQSMAQQHSQDQGEGSDGEAGPNDVFMTSDSAESDTNAAKVISSNNLVDELA